MSKLTVLAIHHVLVEPEPELVIVAFIFQFDPVRLFHNDLELSRGFADIIVDSVGDLEVVSSGTFLVDHDPFFIEQVDSLLNG